MINAMLPSSYSAALAMMLLCMVAWGSWTNMYRLARKWRLEFFHVDWALGLFFIAVVASTFSALPFTADAGSASGLAILCAVTGGAVLNLGNFLLMVGIGRVGMAVAFPVSVGFALVVSTLLSYSINPLGNAALLTVGVALVFCAVLANSLAYRLRSAGTGSRSWGGLVMCFVAGVLFSMAGPLVAKALSTVRPLTPYGVAVLYAAGSLLITLPLFLYMVWKPVDGPPFSLRDYLNGSVRNHLTGFAGGLIWGAGMVMGFLAAGLVGMALSGAIGQANPLVAAIWGVLVWREFRGAPPRAGAALAVTILLYTAGLVVLARSF